MQGNISKVSKHHFSGDGAFPNSRYPVLIYRGAIHASDVTPEAIEQMFQAGGWPPQWRSTIYEYHHFHSTAHEVLGVAAGSASVALGGPDGKVMEVGAGDVVVIPAGVSHKLEDATEDFLVIGAYPPGQDWDLLRGDPEEYEAAQEAIAQVKLPQTDPVSGGLNPLRDAWKF